MVSFQIGEMIMVLFTLKWATTKKFMNYEEVDPSEICLNGFNRKIQNGRIQILKMLKKPLGFST